MTPIIPMLNIYSITALVIFMLGLFSALTRRNAIAMLMGVELMLNGAALNFIAFSRGRAGLDGHVMALFIIVIAAAEAVVALAILITIYKRRGNIDASAAMELKN